MKKRNKARPRRYMTSGDYSTLALAARDRGATAEEVADVLHCRYRTAADRCRRLERQGLIQSAGSGYRITDDGFRSGWRFVEDVLRHLLTQLEK